MSFVFMLLGHFPLSAFAQQRPFATDAQKYNNGYEDGLKKSQQDSLSQVCDATIPGGHSLPYDKGYSAGYSKGPCGSSSTSSAPTSSVPVPGLIFPP